MDRVAASLWDGFECVTCIYCTIYLSFNDFSYRLTSILLSKAGARNRNQMAALAEKSAATTKSAFPLATCSRMVTAISFGGAPRSDAT